jgi:DNA-binding GntR family transcriptional regulator
MRTIGLSGFLDEARPFQTHVLSDHEMRADEPAARALGVAQGTLIRHVRARVSFDEMPYTVTDSYTQVSAGPVTVGRDGTRLGYGIEKAEQELDAVCADTLLARELRLKRGAPVMRARRIYFAAGRRPVQYFVVRYHPDHYRFVVDLLSRGGASTYQMATPSPSTVAG